MVSKGDVRLARFDLDEGNLAKSFICEKCGNTCLEEIMGNVCVASTISHVDEGGAVDYGEQSNYDGDVIRYQCEMCGHPILGEKGAGVPCSGEELVTALKYLGDLPRCATEGCERPNRPNGAKLDSAQAYCMTCLEFDKPGV